MLVSLFLITVSINLIAGREPFTEIRGGVPGTVQGIRQVVMHDLRRVYPRFYQASPPPAMPEARVSLNATEWSKEESVALTFRVVVDVSDNREYIYRSGRLLELYSVSTGSATRYEVPYYTPLGTWKVISKERSSGVYGPYFLRLAYWNGHEFVPTSIGLHGTNEPALIGAPASHGCIRHTNKVITRLASLLPLGTIVQTVP